MKTGAAEDFGGPRKKCLREGGSAADYDRFGVVQP